MQCKIIHTDLPWFTMLQKEKADLGGRGLIWNYIYGFTSQKPNVEDKLIKHFNCFNLLGTQTDFPGSDFNRFCFTHMITS